MSNSINNTEKLNLINEIRKSLNITKKINQIQITQEHIDWWESLPQVWKMFFIVHLNYNEITKLPLDLYQEIFSDLLDRAQYLFSCFDRDFDRLKEYYEHPNTPFYLDDLKSYSYDNLSKFFNFDDLKKIRCSLKLIYGID